MDFPVTRQSGIPDLKLASLRDADLLTAARHEASAILLGDPKLEMPEHKLIAEAVGMQPSATPG